MAAIRLQQSETVQQLQQMQSGFQQKAARDLELQLLLSSWRCS